MNHDPENGEAIAILRVAAELIGRGGWTRHRLAADAAGRSVRPDSSAAARWSLGGALYAAGDAYPPMEGPARRRPAYAKAVAAVTRAIGSPLLGHWNDRPQRTADDAASAIGAAVRDLAAGTAAPP